MIASWEGPTTGPTTGFVFAAITVFAVPTLVAIAFKYWPKTRMGKAFLGELPREDEVVPEDPRRALIGRVGVARSKMLPSGAVEIDGQMVDAMTQGQAIEPGAYVVVDRSAGKSRRRATCGQRSTAKPSGPERYAIATDRRAWHRFAR